MTAIFEIMVFIVYTMTLIFNSFDSVFLGENSILDIFLSIMYLSITFWGIFSLLQVKNESNKDD